MTKTKLFNWLFALIVLVAGLNLASCSDDDYLPGEEEKVHVPNANLLGQSRCTQLAVFRKQGHDFLPTFLCFLPTFGAKIIVFSLLFCVFSLPSSGIEIVLVVRMQLATCNFH